MYNYTLLKEQLNKKGVEYTEKGKTRRTLTIKNTGDTISPSQLSKKKFDEMTKRYGLENLDNVPKPEKIMEGKKLKPTKRQFKKVFQKKERTDSGVVIDGKPIVPTYISPFPSTGAKASNDIEDINADYMPESNANNGTPAIEPEHQSLKPLTGKVKVNQEDRKRETNEPNINILNNITPASLSSPVVLPTTNLVAQQQTNIDANNTALAPSQQVERQEASKPIETQKGLNTEDKSNLNNLTKGLEQDNMLNIDNKDVLDEANMIIKNASNKINDAENIDVDAKVLTLAEKEIQNGLESDKEAIENQLNKFLQTYDPNLIDYTSPDAIKQYTLLTTQLLRLLNDKVEFLPDIKKGVDQVNKVKAEINQGDNIVKQGKIEPELEKQKDQLDGIHERYVDYNGIKYLELNDYHPALVVGALKL
jgi:hypothetical protein